MAKKKAPRPAPTPAPARGRTRLATEILKVGGKDNADRKKLLQELHPLVKQFAASWQLLADAYEGDGGFLDGSYLWQFPAEIDGDYKERQAHARYHNFLETLIDIYTRHVFSQGVKRETTNEELRKWWDDVDGNGTTLQDFVRDVAAQALNQGHCAALIDRTVDAPVGPAKADERSRVIATRFMATAVLDWRLGARNELTAIKLAEAAPEGPITEPHESDEAAQQIALWDQQEFARFDSEGNLVGEGQHRLGLVPVAVLRPKPSKKHPFIGRPLVRHDQVHALYNRASEEDHVLRNQGFSLLTVAVPADAPNEAIEQTQNAVAANYGVKRALVVRGSTDYKSPDMAIPTTIRENMQFLIRELYRAAHVAYQNDSREAESAEAIRLKNTELNEMLRALAQALTEFEKRLARIWCGWQSATFQQGEAMYEAAQVSVQYPTEFFTKELADDIKAWAEAVRFGLPEEFEKRMKKRLVRRIEPDIPEDVAQEIDKQIDAMKKAEQVDPVLAHIQARAASHVESFTKAATKAEGAAA